MAEKSFAAPFSGPSVYGKFSAVGFMKKYKLSVLVVDPLKNSPVCVTKVGHVNTLSIKEKKEIEKPRKVTTNVSDSIFQEFGIS